MFHREQMLPMSPSCQAPVGEKKTVYCSVCQSIIGVLKGCNLRTVQNKKVGTTTRYVNLSLKITFKMAIKMKVLYFNLTLPAI